METVMMRQYHGTRLHSFICGRRVGSCRSEVTGERDVPTLTLCLIHFRQRLLLNLEPGRWSASPSYPPAFLVIGVCGQAQLFLYGAWIQTVLSGYTLQQALSPTEPTLQPLLV